MSIEILRQEHKLHWWIFVKTLVPWVFIVLAFALMTRYVNFRIVLGSVYDDAYLYASFGVLALMTLSFLLTLWRWTVTTIYIDESYLVYERGIINKSVSKVPLQEIASIDLKQNLFQRLIGAGDLSIDMRGSSLLRVGGLEKPANVQAKIMELRRRMRIDAV